jgi:hypothetical protein
MRKKKRLVIFGILGAALHFLLKKQWRFVSTYSSPKRWHLWARVAGRIFFYEKN